MPGNLPYFSFSGKGRIRSFCRWWRLAWKSTGIGACDGRVVDGVAGQMASGGWPTVVQDFPSACDRATRPEHRRLHTDRGSGCSDHGDAESFRTERDRTTGWDSARAQLAPDPQGVCSLLGRAGEARSGSCREVKRRDARSSINGCYRRLTSRQDPDCLRGPTEERTHTRNPTTPNPNPPHQRQHPHDPGTLSEEGPAGSDFHLETAARPRQRNGWAGGQTKRGDAKRPPTPRRPPRTRQATTPTSTQPTTDSDQVRSCSSTACVPGSSASNRCGRSPG